jgi:hypothetical protein
VNPTINVTWWTFDDCDVADRVLSLMVARPGYVGQVVTYITSCGYVPTDGASVVTDPDARTTPWVLVTRGWERDHYWSFITYALGDPLMMDHPMAQENHRVRGYGTIDGALIKDGHHESLFSTLSVMARTMF